jgi:hypothetical protein
MKKENKHFKVTRTVLLAQLLLESLDEIKTTPYYKQDVKNSVNVLEKKLELFLSKPNKYLVNGEAEQTMMKLGRGFEFLLNQTLENIYEADPMEKIR